MYYITGGQENRKDRKTWKTTRRESDWFQLSLTISGQEMRGSPQGGNQSMIDHPIWKITEGASIAKGWENKQ